MYNDSLYHYGVKGMKWGVRRYQNADGSVTAKGRKRYKKVDEKKLTYEYYTRNELNRLPRKERKAVERYRKDYSKIYRQESKKAYKRAGIKNFKKDWDVSEDGSIYNKKTGKGISKDDFQKAWDYSAYRRGQRKRAAEWLAAAPIMAVSVAGIGASAYTMYLNNK